jgi:hypothetical protein
LELWSESSFCLHQSELPASAAAAIFQGVFDGGVGWGRTQQQQQKSTAAAAATAARQGQNEINTAMTRNRLRACEVVVYMPETGL